MPILPKGKRVGDPPEDNTWQSIRFRLALGAKRYPIQVAVLCMSIPVGVLCIFLVIAFHKINTQNQNIQANRIELSRRSCTNDNAQSDAINRLNGALQDIIRAGPEQTKKLSPLLKEAGIPVDQLLKQAREQAEQNATQVAAAQSVPRDCDEEVKAVRELTTPGG